MITRKRDPLTGVEFQPRRSNQRFANRINQIRYNNENARRHRKAMAAINKPLNKNFQILNEIMAEKKEASFHKQFLAGKKYDFGLHTHLENYQNKTYYAIYNFIIIPENPEHIKFIKK